MSTAPTPTTTLPVSGESDADAATDGLILALYVGAITLGFCLVLFEVLRRSFPTVFEYRQALKDRGDENSKGYYGEALGTCAAPSRTPFIGWISSVLEQSPESLEKTHGLDAACFVRFVRSRVLLFGVLSCFSCILLLPVYWTGPNKDLGPTDPLKTRGLQRFSMGNVSTEDPWRFWYVWAVYALSVAVTTGFMFLDYKAYVSARKRYRASKNPANFACLVQDIPLNMCSEKAIESYWKGLFPNDVEYVHQAKDAQKLVKKKVRWLQALTKRERFEMIYEETGERPMHKLGGPCKPGASETVDSIEHWKGREDYYAQKINEYQSQKDPSTKGMRPLRAAIVVFKTRKAAAIAAQTSYAREPNRWKTERAPEPNAVNWAALAISGKTTDLRVIAVAAAIIALTLFWIIPVIAIQGLANLQALSEIELGGKVPFKFLATVKTWGDAPVAFVEGLLPPIIQAVFLALIPVFIRLLCGLCRVPSHGQMDVSVRNWFFFFLFFNGFLFVLIGGSALQAAPDLIRMVQEADIHAFANVLAQAVPSQGTFFMTFIVLQALSTTPQLLVQIVRVALRWIFQRFLCKTEREKQAKDAGGSLFLYFRFYAFAQLVTVIGLVYLPVSPFVVPCCLLYFVITYAVYTYNLTYNMVDQFSEAGGMFPGSIAATFMALIFQGLVLAGIFALRGQATQSTLSFVMAGLSGVAHMYTTRMFSRIAEHGSLEHTLMAEDEEKGRKTIRPDVARKYAHPGFAPLPGTAPPAASPKKSPLSSAASQPASSPAAKAPAVVAVAPISDSSMKPATGALGESAGDEFLDCRDE